MKFPEPRTFLGATSPVILTNWIFGMGIFEYPIGHPRPKISLCWSIAHIFLLSTLLIVAELDNLGRLVNSGAAMGNWNIFTLSSIVSIIIFVYFGHTESKNVATSLRTLNTVNKMMKKYEIPEEYGSTFRYQFIQLAGTILFESLVLVSNILVTVYGRHNRILPYASLGVWHYVLTYSFIVDCTFANLIRYIGKRFEHLNVYLIRSSSWDKHNTHPFVQSLELEDSLRPTILEIHANQHIVRLANKQWMVHLIWNIRKIHQELSSTARTLNRAFGIQILSSMITSFVLITAMLYGIYAVVRTSNSAFAITTIRDVIIVVTWVVFCIIKLLFVVCVCSMTSHQARKMGELIHRVDSPAIDRQVREEICAFSLLLMQNPLRFTANGFFTLEYPIIGKMVGAVTTYLVIMIQLRTRDDPRSAPVNTTSLAMNSTN